MLNCRPPFKTHQSAPGKSQLWVAYESKTDLSYLSVAERGFHSLSITKLADLCDVLDIKLSEFFLDLESTIETGFEAEQILEEQLD